MNSRLLPQTRFYFRVFWFVAIFCSFPLCCPDHWDCFFFSLFFFFNFLFDCFFLFIVFFYLAWFPILTLQLLHCVLCRLNSLQWILAPSLLAIHSANSFISSSNAHEVSLGIALCSEDMEVKQGKSQFLLSGSLCGRPWCGTREGSVCRCFCVVQPGVSLSLGASAGRWALGSLAEHTRPLPSVTSLPASGLSPHASPIDLILLLYYSIPPSLPPSSAPSLLPFLPPPIPSFLQFLIFWLHLTLFRSFWVLCAQEWHWCSGSRERLV